MSNLIYITFNGNQYWCTIQEIILTFLSILFIIAILILYRQLKHFKPRRLHNTQNNSYYSDFKTADTIIIELMRRSNLSKLICTDIYYILLDFKFNNKNSAYNKIYSTLIPHLKLENKIGNVGIAFGMLIDNDIALTQEEALNFSEKVMKEMIT